MPRANVGGKAAATIIGRRIAGVLTKPLKRAVKALDVGDYRTLKAMERTGDQLEHHHVPSFAALKAAKEKELKRPLTKAEKDALKKDGAAIELGKDTHGKTRTFQRRNTTDQIANDGADLAAAAERDYADVADLLRAEGGWSESEITRALGALRRANKARGIG